MLRTKQILLALLFLAVGAVLPSTAQSTQLVISLRSGETVFLALADNPVITHTGTTFHAEAGATAVTASMADVLRYTFAEALTDGVHQQPTSTGDVRVLADGVASFIGLEPECTVSIVGADGRTLRSVRAGSDGRAEIRFGDLPAGAYVVRAGKTAIKVVNNKQ